MPSFDPDTHLTQLIRHLNEAVLLPYFTVLCGGAKEPFYRATCESTGPDGKTRLEPARIEFRQDFVRSALHELAHWCIAGKTRRQIDDYGYWYAPDGRTAEQQRAFFQVEVKPQALEQVFCQALGIDFSVSIDNLGGEPPSDSDIDEFQQAIQQQCEHWRHNGLPPRAAAILEALHEFGRGIAINA